MALWLKANYPQKEAINVARSFLAYLETEQFNSAFTLSVKQGDVGNSPTELQAIAERELCHVDSLRGTHPFQSNGNRLKRWIAGREIEMPELTVEFSATSPPCLLSVKLRWQDNQWRVFRFYRHAG